MIRELLDLLVNLSRRRLLNERNSFVPALVLLSKFVISGIFRCLLSTSCVCYATKVSLVVRSLLNYKNRSNAGVNSKLGMIRKV